LWPIGEANYLVEGFQHDVNAAAEQHGVSSLDSDLEGVPDGQLTGGLGSDLLRLDGSLVDEGGEIVAVVVVKPLERNAIAIKA